MNPASFNQAPDAAVRAEQVRFARSQIGAETRRPTLSVVRGAGTTGSKPVNTNAPKGHEAFLKGLENSAVPVTFEKISSGEKITGVIKTSDKYTVSIMQTRPDGTYQTRVLFKHDISEFMPQIPPAVIAAATAEKAN